MTGVCVFSKAIPGCISDFLTSSIRQLHRGINIQAYPRTHRQTRHHKSQHLPQRTRHKHQSTTSQQPIPNKAPSNRNNSHRNRLRLRRSSHNLPTRLAQTKHHGIQSIPPTPSRTSNPKHLLRPTGKSLRVIPARLLAHQHNQHFTKNPNPKHCLRPIPRTIIHPAPKHRMEPRMSLARLTPRTTRPSNPPLLHVRRRRRRDNKPSFGDGAFIARIQGIPNSNAAALLLPASWVQRGEPGLCARCAACDAVAEGCLCGKWVVL